MLEYIILLIIGVTLVVYLSYRIECIISWYIDNSKKYKPIEDKFNARKRK